MFFNDRLRSIEGEADLKNQTKDEALMVEDVIVQPNTLLLAQKSRVDIFKL